MIINCGLHDFSVLKIVDICFIAQHVVSLKKYSMLVEKNVYSVVIRCNVHILTQLEPAYSVALIFHLLN